MSQFDISKFGLKEVTECTAILRKIGKDCQSMEEAANKIVNFFYTGFTDPKTAKGDFVLVRLFKTHEFIKLKFELQTFAEKLLSGVKIYNETKCLTLVATAGEDENWKSSKDSKGHKAIPLLSEEVVNRIPMIRNLIKQLGLDVKTIIKPDPKIIQDLSEKTFNVFLIPEARGSLYIPAQSEFVIPFGIKSVLGFGGIFPDGNIFTIIIFSKKSINDGTANLFRTLSLAIKISLLPFTEQVFFNEQ